MITEDQSDVLGLLGSPLTHRGAVERIDTHTAVVFLTGELAFKLKRAVRFDYVDFSTAEMRRRCCEAEVTLNRRTAPDLYRRVIPVTREADGSLLLNGNGIPVDWVIEMRRFSQEDLLDHLAAVGRLDLGLMGPLAERIAAFHLSAENCPSHGGAAGMRWVADGNAAGLLEFGADLDPTARAHLAERTSAALERLTAPLDLRRQGGYVRHCHGDLHLGNIVLLGGQPTLFDGIEFNDELACSDVLYDLAFLVMDLWHRRLSSHANVILNRYLSVTHDYDGLQLLPFFLSCRAAVRAKTSATSAQMQQGDRRLALTRSAAEYLAMAEMLLEPGPPRLLAIGGLSGTGKSTLAMGLAPSVGVPPGAIVLRSDEIRKELCKVGRLERLGSAAYTPAVSANVYHTLRGRAADVLRAGYTVIADAVWTDAEQRQGIEQVARAQSAQFDGLWLDAPATTLVARVGRRSNDPSDANETVVINQTRRPLGTVAWHHLDATGSPEQVLHAAGALLRPPS